MNLPTLATLPPHLRLIAFWIVVTLTVGYSTGLLFVFHTTHFTPHGAVQRYRGNQTPTGEAASADDQEMTFEKSYPEMLNITHTHILSMASFFAMAAVVFAFTTTTSPRVKTFLIAEPFVAILVSFSCLWLMRYVHPAFSWLLGLSSGTMALCFYAMMIISLAELVRARRNSQPPTPERFFTHGIPPDSTRS